MKLCSRKTPELYDQGIRTVWLTKCFHLFRPNTWYCRFSKESDPLGPLGFFHAEHTNRFTAYRQALAKTKAGRVPKYYDET